MGRPWDAGPGALHETAVAVAAVPTGQILNKLMKLRVLLARTLYSTVYYMYAHTHTHTHAHTLHTHTHMYKRAHCTHVHVHTRTYTHCTLDYLGLLLLGRDSTVSPCKL